MPKPAPVIPSDMLCELTVDLIDEGKLVAAINSAISEAGRALRLRRDRGDSGGKCSVSVRIELEYDPEIRDRLMVTTWCDLKTPRNERVSEAKELGGRVLCRPEGTSEDPVDQLRLFNRDGKAVATLDLGTGELLEPPAKAGKIG